MFNCGEWFQGPDPKPKIFEYLFGKSWSERLSPAEFTSRKLPEVSQQTSLSSLYDKHPPAVSQDCNCPVDLFSGSGLGFFWQELLDSLFSRPTLCPPRTQQAPRLAGRANHCTQFHDGLIEITGMLIR